MTEIFSKQEPNNKTRCQHNTKLWLAIISTAMGVVVSSLVFRNSFKSNWMTSHTKSILNDQATTLHLQEENILNGQTTASRLQKDSIFNGDIAIPYFPQDIHQQFSKFRCTGSENDIDAWRGRLCVFYNTCYNRDTGHFYYFQCAQRETKLIFYDSGKGMLFQFSNKNAGINFLSLSSGGGTPWSPIAVNETYPVGNFTRLHQLHSLMSSRFAAHNIGHGLWGDLGSILYSMERMNVVDRNLVIMHFTKIPNTTLFDTYHQYVIPALTKNPMVEFEVYVKFFNTKYVCFDRLIVGGQLAVFPRAHIKENHGREALFYSWRSKIIQYNGFDPKFVPRRHHVIITKKSNSMWTHHGAKRHRAIVNLEEVEKFIRLTYPTISTEVVEWHTIPFNMQIQKLINTTILITPCGGVSLILPMLPHGAHAIVMDFYVAKEAHGYYPGQSGSMEGAFLNQVSHVRKQYYQVYGPQDYEFDYPGASDPREDSSIIVNMTRLQLLIDKALEEMEP